MNKRSIAQHKRFSKHYSRQYFQGVVLTIVLLILFLLSFLVPGFWKVKGVLGIFLFCSFITTMEFKYKRQEQEEKIKAKTNQDDSTAP